MKDGVIVTLVMVDETVRLSALLDKSDVPDAVQPITSNVIGAENVANERLIVTDGAVGVKRAVTAVYEGVKDPAEWEAARDVELVCEVDRR